MYTEIVDDIKRSKSGECTILVVCELIDLKWEVCMIFDWGIKLMVWETKRTAFINEEVHHLYCHVILLG